MRANQVKTDLVSVTAVVQDKPWVFCQDEVNARDVDLKRWPSSDIRYRGVFRTLARAPRIGTGLWEGGSEECQQELLDSQSRAQAQVVYALLDEIGRLLDLKHLTADARRVFYLKYVVHVYHKSSSTDISLPFKDLVCWSTG